MKNKLFYVANYSSLVGELLLIADDKFLTHILWRNKKQRLPQEKALIKSAKNEANAVLKKTVKQLDEYFNGKRTEFDLPIKQTGTPFQEQVWRQLEKIPYGKTISYKILAERINNAKAVRAVGSANGKNNLPIIVPCHRVIAADNTLGGYASGLDNKKHLLDLEARFV